MITIIFNRYVISSEAVVYDLEKKKRILPNNKYQFNLIIDGERKKISLKRLYRLAFNEEYCIDNIENLKDEQWKQYSFDDRYYISNKGRIKSYCKYNAIILKQQTKKNGYLEVMIKGKHKYCHRLTAEAFIENKDNLDTVDHLDFIRTNNDISNLRYLSRADNSKRKRKCNENKKILSAI